ncbi:ATP-binding protein [Parabacteroides sp.]
MRRKIYMELLKWKNSVGRKPLILRGARQVGKTWILKEFGRCEYKNFIYVNCDNEPRVARLFEDDYDIDRILLALQAITGIKAVPGETLIILDEIQEVKRGLGSLKYFCEDAPEYHVAVAGSLLGIALHQGTSFPVGKVDMIDMYPMDFGEFLDALDDGQWKELLESHDWTLLSSMRTKFIEFLRQYYYVGGMPEVVHSFVEQQDLKEVRRLQQDILQAYRSDISKHAPVNEVVRINMVMNSIPSQLAKENKKFIYGAMKKGARAAEFELAIQWLIDCGIIYKVNRVRTPKLPLKFYEDMSAFKLFMLDCGLLACMSEVPADQMLIGDNVFEEFKGAFTEEYVMQQLITHSDIYIYYWSSEKSDGEIDFLIQYGARVIPIEVKAEENVRARSLRQFVTDNPDLKGIRFSMSDYREQEWMNNIPLYAAFCCWE